ncbi:pilus assembly protein PilN [Colwellia sp. PAMC 20917]|jgi:type IV pilus assembly protein PilN|uniref:PilN domain-containing protein n=1 Tax=unclassified Colwellia TaxID=196834 RepID=UPI000878AB1F|nr:MULTISPECIES: PilN domain-containing protein [unclassified Colwellia]AOW77588.1 pilus assembly protein PilN [Colwellia sp. PAMC 20917]MBA6349565.1 PilN domain-containing protein [Colwellia sp. BRX8-9]MBA6351536.1 PilN domain-containing protein [Colwellia sp. BRX9-1]MBA6354768.1 PilN domain-containing protein [Colwellia sp. BRX8-3]MBA6359970.1 PilN domain-containing protein [Colwellia sp. BRX8-6]|tara:strand:- start:1636 stop:2226 length:591 start_codon:yes stop_codon:yes gene_type:complete
MAFINLLPWREEAEKAKQREYFTLLTIVAVIAFALVFIISQFYQMRIDGQNSRNQFLKTEIALLDARIIKIKNLNEKKKELQKRTQVVEQLQRSRNVGTQVFDEIAKIVPTGVYLTRLEKQGNSINIVGKSESNNHLANMIREIERSVLFTDAILESITTNEAKNKLLSDFKMRVRIKGLLNSGDDGKVITNGGKS